MMDSPGFPPLLTGRGVELGIDPFEKAQAWARREAEPGLIVWAENSDTMRAAVTFAPEVPLIEALPGAVFATLLGINDALGALAPPAMAVHFVWPDRIMVNGAWCGRIRAAAASNDPGTVPDWLVVGIEMPLLPQNDDNPGHHPDETTLFAEGCTDLPAARLIESWARHMLVWINRFLEDGFAPLHEGWCHKCNTLGGEVSYPARGTFMGLDETGSMILRHGKNARAIPLATLLEAA
jgi:BirA family biotin operon repressor/biotin-[acetyl-CoA-carboxylase] ligase